MGDDLKTQQGYPVSLSVFLGMGCDAINEKIRSSQDITATYKVFVSEIDNIYSDLWKTSENGGCFAPLCQQLFGGGNPDITGIGVVVAYALEILLAVFLSSLLIHAWRRSGEKEIPKGNAKTRALASCLSVFADTSIFFALAIVLATCIMRNPHYIKVNGISYYDSIQAVLASTTTVAPCLAALFALQCCGEKVGRQISILGLACLINIAVIVIPNAVDSVTGKDGGTRFGISDPQLSALANGPNAYYSSLSASDKQYFHRNGDMFNSACYAKLTSQTRIIWAGFYIGVALGIIGQVIIMGFVILMALGALRHRAKQGWHKMRTKTSKSYTGTKPAASERRTLQETKDVYRPRKLEIFAFMFCPLALSVWTGCALLGQRILLTRSWNGEDETKWGFGQMVALLMFLPVLLEFPYQWVANRPSRQERTMSNLSNMDSNAEEGKGSSDGKVSGTYAEQELKNTADDTVRPTAARTSSEIVPAKI